MPNIWYASLWAVSCVGLACGIGFYFAATLAAATIGITLVVFKRFERRIWLRNTHRTVNIRTQNLQPTLTSLNALFAKIGAEIKNTEFIEPDTPNDSNDAPMIAIRFTIRMPNFGVPELYDEIKNVGSVDSVSIE